MPDDIPTAESANKREIPDDIPISDPTNASAAAGPVSIK